MRASNNIYYFNPAPLDGGQNQNLQKSHQSKKKMKTKIICQKHYAVINENSRKCIEQAMRQLGYTGHNYGEYERGAHLEFSYRCANGRSVDRCIIEPTNESLTTKKLKI